MTGANLSVGSRRKQTFTAAESVSSPPTKQSGSLPRVESQSASPFISPKHRFPFFPSFSQLWFPFFFTQLSECNTRDATGHGKKKNNYVWKLLTHKAITLHTAHCTRQSSSNATQHISSKLCFHGWTIRSFQCTESLESVRISAIKCSKICWVNGSVRRRFARKCCSFHKKHSVYKS